MAGWTRVEDVLAYQLAVRLRDEILRLTEIGPVLKDRDFRDQIRDSVRSAPRNLAEGFNRYSHREFAYFVNVAKGSIAETINHVEDARTQSYFSAGDSDRLQVMATEALRTTTGLLRHLRTTHAPAPYGTATPTRRTKH